MTDQVEPFSSDAPAVPAPEVPARLTDLSAPALTDLSAPAVESNRSDIDWP
jgi:hypothetical protein